MTGDVLFALRSTAAVALRPRVIAALSARGRRGVPDPPTEHCRTQRRGGEPRDGRAAAFAPLRSADVKRSVVSGACVAHAYYISRDVRGVS